MNAYIEKEKLIVPHLEIHAAHACNLKCISCSHYSYSTFQKNSNLEDFENQFFCWSKKINPRVIRVLGGEPFINKELDKLIVILRKYFYKTNNFELYTNGLLIKNSNIDLSFIEKNNISLVISIHSNNSEYLKRLKENTEFLDNKKIKYYTVNSIINWRKTHNVINGIVTPFYDNNERKSWEVCRAKNCKQLYDNKIYKCPQTTYIKMIKNYKIHEDYSPMLNYKPLEFKEDLSLETIKEFWNIKEENICKMCPANVINIKKGNPMKDHKKIAFFL